MQQKGHAFLDGISLMPEDNTRKTKTNNRLADYILLSSKIRIAALMSAAFLFVFMGLFVFPIASSVDGTQATSKQSETVLTISADDLTLNFDIDSVSGSFADDSANVSITTNNITGYTLSINTGNTGDNAGKLVGENQSFNPISSATSEADFTNSTDYNGLWGYKPSKVNGEANTSYLPAPTEQTTIESTTAPNAQANVYEIALGARADMSYEAGGYTNTFIITAIANPVSYTISYDKNTLDTVENMPTAQTGSTSSASITLSNLIPERDNYVFLGWCDGTTSGQTCSGIVYQPGDSYEIDHVSQPNRTLYAVWQDPVVVTYHLDNNTNVVAYNLDTITGHYVVVSGAYVAPSDEKGYVQGWATYNGGDVYYWSEDEIINSIENNSFHDDDLYSASAVALTIVDGGDLHDAVNVNTRTIQMASAPPTAQQSGVVELSCETDHKDECNTSTYVWFNSSTSTTYLYTLANKIKVEDVYLLRFDNYYYSALEYIPAFSDFDVSGNLRFEYLFSDVDIVDYSPISNWDTSSATGMEYMFSHSSFDDTTVLSTWDVSSVEDMEGMFRANSNIVNLNGLTNWDTSSVTDMSRMFESASSLASIDGVTNWDVSDVENMEDMFAGIAITNLNALTTGTRSGKNYVSWDVSSVTNTSGMFNGADSLINIDGISNWDISSVTDMSEMFSGARNIAWLQSLNGWGVPGTIDMDDMFYNIPCTVVRPVWYVFADGCSSSGGSGGTVTIGYALELYYTEVLHKGMYVANNDGTGAYHEMQPDEQLPSGVDTRFALQDFTASICSSVTVLDDVYGVLDLTNWGIVNITKSSSDGLCHRLDTGAVIP